MLIKIRKIIKNEKGQSLVELALVLPILLLLLFGIIEFGRIFNAALIVTNASREGVREGVIGASDADITNYVKNSVYILDKNKVTVTIQPTQTYRKSGDDLKIHVEYPVKVYAPFISAIVGNTYTVKADTTMRVE